MMSKGKSFFMTMFIIKKQYSQWTRSAEESIALVPKGNNKFNNHKLGCCSRHRKMPRTCSFSNLDINRIFVLIFQQRTVVSGSM